MGTLADLVGPVERIDPPLTVNVGEIMVTLRHSSPRDIVRPGRKLRRGKGLPLTLDPHGIRVSTEDIPVGVEVPAIALPGPFGLPLVKLRVVIRVNERDDYVALRRYIAEKGINFAELLEGDLANDMDMHVRETLSQYSLEDLYEAGNISRIVGSRSTLLDHLFRIESIQQERIVWDPEFEAIQKAIAATKREEAEKLLRLSQIPIDREVTLAEDQLAMESASRRGVSLWELEHPEQVALASQQDHELRLEAIRQMDAIRRGAGAEGVRAVLGMRSPLETAAGRGTEYRPPSPPGLAPAGTAYGEPGGPTGTERDSTGPSQTIGGGHRQKHGSGGLDTVRRDNALAQVWKGANLPGNPFGLAQAGKPPNSIVVAVVDTPLGAADIATITRTLRNLVGAEFVVAISQPRNIGDIIIRYLSALVPALPAANPRWGFHVDGRILNVSIGSPTTRVGPIVREINDEATGILAPLERLLPFDAIDVEVADAR